MNRERLGAVVASGFLAAELLTGCSGQSPEPQATTLPAATVDYVVPASVNRIEVDFVQIPGSQPFTEAQQAHTVAKIGSAVDIWRAASRGVLFNPKPSVVNGGEHMLTDAGNVRDVCNDEKRLGLEGAISAGLKHERPIGEHDARIIVLQGTKKYCANGQGEVSAEAALGSRELISYEGIGPNLAAHELGHAISKLNDSAGYDCTNGMETKVVELGLNCEKLVHQDFNTVMSGLSGAANDHDNLTGLEMYRLNLITPEQVIVDETPGSTTYTLSAIHNPAAAGQTKLVQVPLAKIDARTLLKTHADSLYIELSGEQLPSKDCGKTLCPDAPEDLSVKVYLGDKDAVRTDDTANAEAPTFYQVYTAPFGVSSGAKKAGQDIVIKGKEGTLHVGIDALKVTAPAEGSVTITVDVTPQ